MSKRGALDAFFKPKAKAQKTDKHTIEPAKDAYTDHLSFIDTEDSTSGQIQQYASKHPTFPLPIPVLPSDIKESFNYLPACTDAQHLNSQPHLDVLYFCPFIPRPADRSYFEFLRSSLPWYRVQYTIKRGTLERQINTPRWTTVFGVDATSQFSEDGLTILDAHSKKQVSPDRYKCRPRPVPQCLDVLRKATEAVTGETFNFVLVNYYADGDDSISYHSDDERFLGQDPAIASFSLGAKRDFLMRHKPVNVGQPGFGLDKQKPLKLELASGDMILMKGKTQSNWLHSIPKRKGSAANQGRINITLRKAMIKYGTENYYQYNVGSGAPYGWNNDEGKMKEIDI